MTAYLVLLRGINVGGRNKVPMAELRSVLEDLGFDNVSTYIASGNVFLDSDLSAAKVASKIEAALPKAFKLARTGRPGPVHIDVPYDLWIRTADVEVPEPEERSQHLEWRTPGSPEAVGRALEMLMKAKRPLVLAGGGVISSDATEQLRQFAEHVNVPVYSTFMGKGALSARHPLHLGIAEMRAEVIAIDDTAAALEPGAQLAVDL